MMDFDQRLQAGRQWEEELFNHLLKHPKVVSVAFNGTEHTHPDFVDLLRRNSQKSAELLRYQPDGVFLSSDGGVYHFEAKHATSIERNAWMVYNAISSIGGIVIVFVKHPKTGDTFYQDVAEMQLIPGSVTVSRYEKPYPVHDEWIHRPGRTPYREIDFDSMRVFQVGNREAAEVSA